MTGTAESSDCRKLIELTRRLHLLMAEGKGESEEAEALREDVLRAWGFITEDEAKRLNGLSADLYQLTNEEIYARVDPVERTRERLEPRLRAAWERQGWDEVLALLRTGPEYLRQDQIAYLRGRCWTELGHPEIALLFYDYAARTNPG